MLWVEIKSPSCASDSTSSQPIEIFVGDVAAYTLHNLQPGTKYDVKVVAQYTNGMSQPLVGQGTTRAYQQHPHLPSFIPLHLIG